MDLYFCVWSRQKLFLFIQIFGAHFPVNLFVLLAQLENINKLLNSNCNVYVKEQNQNKNKTKSRHIQIDHVFYCSI